jgi:hypothetical protein
MGDEIGMNVQNPQLVSLVFCTRELCCTFYGAFLRNRNEKDPAGKKYDENWGTASAQTGGPSSDTEDL